jgi:uncharacterized protein DUF6371
MESCLLSTISFRLLIQSLSAFNANNFVQFLLSVFGFDTTVALINRYNIGTSKYWPGATVFWQVDIHGKIRSGKIMKYDVATARRIKQPFQHINWAHTVLRLPGFELRQCLFGEHLLGDSCMNIVGRQTGTIAIVESEKTAIIASVYLPQFIWLACGSLTNLTVEKCRVLAGRNVVLFPDLNGYRNWRRKAIELSSIATVTISSLLDKKANRQERRKGLDLADYLLRFDVKEFLNADSKSG